MEYVATSFPHRSSLSTPPEMPRLTSLRFRGKNPQVSILPGTIKTTNLTPLTNVPDLPDLSIWNGNLVHGLLISRKGKSHASADVVSCDRCYFERPDGLPRHRFVRYRLRHRLRYRWLRHRWSRSWQGPCPRHLRLRVRRLLYQPIALDSRQRFAADTVGTDDSVLRTHSGARETARRQKGFVKN